MSFSKTYICPKNIWGACPLQNTVYFRKVFAVDMLPEKAILRIFVDTGYELFLNERFVAQLDEWNNTRDYDVTFLIASGLNVIAVRGDNHGGHRGLAFELRLILPGGKIDTVVSDEDCCAEEEERWGWKSADYDDSQWKNARLLDLSQSGGEQWRNRPGDDPLKVVPCQNNSLFFNSETPKAGASPFYKRLSDKKENLVPEMVVDLIGQEYQESCNESMPKVQIPVKVVEAYSGNGLLVNREGGLLGFPVFQLQAKALAGGPGITIDFGGETVGYLRLRVSSKSASSFRIVFGEMLNDCHRLPPKDALLYKMLVEEATVRPGTHEWESKTRQGFRFVRIEFFDCQSPVEVEGISVRTSIYPTDYQGYFSCSDPLLNRIWKAGRKTLHLCMQEYYLDGIKRDRFLWVGDARLEALINYYAFGDQELFRYCWKELADVQYRDGGIPSVLGEGAPILWDYVAWWIIALADYYLHTGDLDFPRSLQEPLIRATKWLARKSGEDGLINVPENTTENWMCILNKKSGKDLTFNQIYCRALQAAAQLLGALGKSNHAECFDEMAEIAKESFNRLPGSPGIDRFCPDIEHLPSRSLNGFEVIETYFRNNLPNEALQFIRDYWGSMLEAGTDTFWEAPIKTPKYRIDEIRNDSDSLSRCHGWTAGPTYALLAGVVGIRPTAPGFKEFEIRPQLGSLTFAKGVVPTPLGLIAVSIQRERTQTLASVLIPEGCQATLILPSSNSKGASATNNSNGIRLVSRKENESVYAISSGGKFEFQMPTTTGKALNTDSL